MVRSSSNYFLIKFGEVGFLGTAPRYVRYATARSQSLRIGHETRARLEISGRQRCSRQRSVCPLSRKLAGNLAKKMEGVERRCCNRSLFLVTPKSAKSSLGPR